MNHRITERTKSRKRQVADLSRLKGLFVGILACVCAQAKAAPKAILFLSSAPTLRSVFEADAPALQSLITHGGVAVMTGGPPGSVTIPTCGANGYFVYRHGFGRAGSYWEDWHIGGVPVDRHSPPRGYLASNLESYGGIVPVGGVGAAVVADTSRWFGPLRDSEIGLFEKHASLPLQVPIAIRFSRSVRSAAAGAAVVVVDPIQHYVPDDVATQQDSARVGAEDRVLAGITHACPGVPIFVVGVGEPGTSMGGSSGLLWLAASNLRGRLTSDTTRTRGVVSNLDVAPTLIAMVTGRAPSDTAGHEIETGPLEGLQHAVPKPISATIRLQEGLGILESVTDPTNYALAFGAIALIILGSLLCGSAGRPRLKRWTQRALLLPAAVPLAVAIAASRLSDTRAGYYLLAAGLTFALLAIFVLMGKALAVSREDVAPATVEIALGGFCAFVIADVARHGMALRLSPLSDFYQTGIRFYGLGNEYGALFIAAFTLVGLIALQRSGAKSPGRGGLAALGAWYAACALFVGWPTLGANMGGIVIALITGSITWYFVAGKSNVRRPWIWPLVVSILCVAAVFIVDTHSAHPTHLAYFVGGSAARQRETVLLNKAEMNARLIIQPFAWLIYALAAGFAWYWWRRLGVARRRAVLAYPWVAVGIRSVFYGGAFALLTKDTGVVMLGLMAITSIAIGVIVALEPAQPLVLLNSPERR